jgi:hypothetical protein
LNLFRPALVAALLLVSACTFEEGPMPPQPEPNAAPAPAQRAQPTAPNEVAQEILRYFEAAGYRRFQAEALADHAHVESGFRPCAAGPHGLRYMFQWGGLRLQRLREFAGGPGCPSIDVQLAFSDHELRSEANYGCFWRAQDRASAFQALRRGFGQGRC